MKAAFVNCRHSLQIFQKINRRKNNGTEAIPWCCVNMTATATFYCTVQQNVIYMVL